MAANFKKGEAVRVANPLDGVVDQVKFNEDTGEPRYCVAWTGTDGVEHHRWFSESELSAVPAA